MSVRNAGKTIREARLKAGLTQEQLSEGVCSVLSLSRIENGSAGVSPVTFQALMAHAGAPCSSDLPAKFTRSLQAEQTLTVSIPSIVRASIWVPGS